MIYADLFRHLCHSVLGRRVVRFPLAESLAHRSGPIVLIEPFGAQLVNRSRSFHIGAVLLFGLFSRELKVKFPLHRNRKCKATRSPTPSRVFVV